jgi:hypothetical protein
MLDRIIKVGAAFDWISPAASLFQDFTNGPVAAFKISAHAGWTSFDLQDLLRDRGIRAWGMVSDEEAIGFHVRETQARYTCYVLEQAGLDYNTNWSGATIAPQASPAKSAQAVTHQPWSLDGLLQGLDHLLDRL